MCRKIVNTLTRECPGLTTCWGKRKYKVEHKQNPILMGPGRVEQAIQFAKKSSQHFKSYWKASGLDQQHIIDQENR